MNCVDDIIQTYRDSKTMEELSQAGTNTLTFLETLKLKGAIIPEGIEIGLRETWKFYRDKLKEAQPALL